MAKQLRLSPLIGSGMVIQQQLSFLLMGFCRADAKISARLERSPFDGRSVSSLDKEYGCVFEEQIKADSNGHFSFELPAMEASFDPYTLFVKSGREEVIVRNILVGEVWVMAGQSDMSVKLAEGFSPEELGNLAGHQYISFLVQSEDGLDKKNNQYSPQPLDKPVNSHWISGDYLSEIGKVTALSFYFAKDLVNVLRLPVAVIETAMCGTYIHSWISRPSIDAHEHIRQKIENYGFYRDDNTWHMAGDWGCYLPGALYNHKIAPLSGIGIRGIIWHQGGKDRANAEYYRSAMKYLMQDWQSVFRIPAASPKSQIRGTEMAETNVDGSEMPENCAWICLQHLPAAYKDDDSGYDLALYNEALAQIRHQVKNPCSILPVYDLYAETKNKIQNSFSEKFPVDIKAAAGKIKQIASGLLYHRKASLSSPECTGIELVGGKMLLSFDHTAEGLRLASQEGRLRGFSICGEDRIFREAQAKILYGVRVMVWHDQIPRPKAVTYGFSSMNHAANLINSEHLPVMPFRSDRKKSEYYLPAEWIHCDRLTDWACDIKFDDSERCKNSRIPQRLPVWEVKKGNAELSLETANKQHGDASIMVRYPIIDDCIEISPCLEYESLFPPFNLTNCRFINLEIFNPDRQMKKIWLKIAMSENPDEAFISSEKIVMAALRWQEFSFDLNQIIQVPDKTKYLYSFSICVKDGKSSGSVNIDHIQFLANDK